MHDASARSVTLTQNQIWFILRAVEGYRDEILYDLTGVRPTPEQQEEIDALAGLIPKIIDLLLEVDEENTNELS